MSVPRTSSTETTKTLIRDHSGALVGIIEHDRDTIFAQYSVIGNVIEKWSIHPSKRSRSEFSGPVSLRYHAYQDQYTVSACGLDGGSPPAVLESMESSSGMLRHFKIKEDLLSDWLKRIA